MAVIISCTLDRGRMMPSRSIPTVHRTAARAASSPSASACPSPVRCAATSPASPRSPAPPCSAATGRLGESLDRRRSPRSAPQVRQVPSRTTTTSRSARSSSTPPGSRDSADLRALLRLLPPGRSARSAPSGRARRARHAARAGRRAAARRSPSARSRASCARPPRSCASGATGQLVYVAPGRGGQRASPRCASCCRARSAYVSGQVVRVGAGEQPDAAGLGAAAGRPRRAGHRRLARHRRGDRPRRWPATAPTSSASTSPPRATTLAEVANEIGGSSLLLDITDEDAPAAARRAPAERHGGVDVVVHNAGVTRDRTLGRMSDERVGPGARRSTSPRRSASTTRCSTTARCSRGGRIVTVSSMSGIAGNRGQANYARLQGRRDRHRRGARARCSPSAARRSTRSPPASSRRR